LRTEQSFKGTALENMGTNGIKPPVVDGFKPLEPLADVGKMTKYSEWKFIAESPQKNDHSKIYRAYHEGW